MWCDHLLWHTDNQSQSFLNYSWLYLRVCCLHFVNNAFQHSHSKTSVLLYGSERFIWSQMLKFVLDLSKLKLAFIHSTWFSILLEIFSHYLPLSLLLPLSLSSLKICEQLMIVPFIVWLVGSFTLRLRNCHFDYKDS